MKSIVRTKGGFIHINIMSEKAILFFTSFIYTYILKEPTSLIPFVVLLHYKCAYFKNVLQIEYCTHNYSTIENEN